MKGHMKARSKLQQLKKSVKVDTSSKQRYESLKTTAVFLGEQLDMSLQHIKLQNISTNASSYLL